MSAIFFYLMCNPFTSVGGKSCDWLALDNNTGEPLSMKANFSSTQAAEEFVEIFNQVCASLLCS